MGCRFIFPESDFDPSNSIGSRNLSVLTSTLIGLATESSSNRFSILLSTLFPVATGHNRNAAAKSRKSRSWRQKKFSGFYSFFAYVRQNSTTEFGVKLLVFFDVNQTWHGSEVVKGRVPEVFPRHSQREKPLATRVVVVIQTFAKIRTARAARLFMIF